MFLAPTSIVVYVDLFLDKTIHIKKKKISNQFTPNFFMIEDMNM